MPALTGGPMFASPALSDRAALTGGTVAGSMPLSNLQTQQPSEPCRFIDLADIHATWDFGTPTDIGFACVLYSNIGPGTGTIQLRASNTFGSLTTSPSYNSSVQPFVSEFLPPATYTRFPSYLISPNLSFGTYRYWRVDLTPSTPSAGFVQVGRAFLSGATSYTLMQLSRGALSGLTLNNKETPARIESAGGQIFTGVRARRSYMKFSVPFEDENIALKNLQSIQITRGSSRTICTILDPTDPDNMIEKSIYGLMTVDDKPHTGFVQGTGLTYNLACAIEEVP